MHNNEEAQAIIDYAFTDEIMKTAGFRNALSKGLNLVKRKFKINRDIRGMIRANPTTPIADARELAVTRYDTTAAAKLKKYLGEEPVAEVAKKGLPKWLIPAGVGAAGLWYLTRKPSQEQYSDQGQYVA